MDTIDYRSYGLGCLKDKYDPRDYIFSPFPTCATAYPTAYMLEKMPIKNQQTVNSCVAHACATIKEIQEFYETGRKQEFSTGWIYGYRTNNQYRGEGMYPKEAMTNLLNIGNVFASDFPENFEYNDIQGLIVARKTHCLSKAKQYKIKSYARVTSSNGVKAALYNYHSPVMIVCDIFDNFYNVTGDGIVPTGSGNYCGSHAMVIVGWTKISSTEYYVVQNSWGETWGDNGYCYIKPSNSIITDIYTSIDSENNTINFSDVSGGKHWAEEYINKCVKAGLINGYSDGTFKPNNTITRAEICTMFAKMLNK